MGEKETKPTTIWISDEEYRGLQKLKHELEVKAGHSDPFSDVIGKIRREWEACTCGPKKVAG